MQKIIGITAALLFFLHTCVAQYTISGTVTDELQHPLQSVTVTVGKGVLTSLTDSAGNYSFSYSTANMLLSFSHVGYEPVMKNIYQGKVATVTLVRSSYFLPGTVVNSFERNRDIKNIPAAVSVLNKPALERYGTESFVPAISTVPGVKMDERSPGSYRLSIRGNLLRSTFGVRNVKIYWNGIPFTDANGNSYFNELSPNSIGSIEILKGPSGSMYGAGTGGVVLLKSDLHKEAGKNISVQSIVGSYGLFTANISYDQSNKKSVSGLSFSHQQSDGYRVQTNMRRDMANYAGQYFINAKQTVSANIFYSDLYYQTPGALTMAEMLADPRQARPAAGAFPGAEAQQAAIYLKTFYAGIANEYRFNDRWNNTTAVYFSNTNSRNPAIRNYERKTEHGTGARTVTKYQRKIFTATFGAEYQYGFTNTGTFGNHLGSTDTLQYHDKIDSRQFNLFLQTDISLLEDFILNAGISYNNFYYGFQRQNIIPSLKQTSNFTPQIVPRISILKKIQNRMSVYASVSKGYSPPSIDEVHAGDGNFNRALNAETALNYEAGIKGDIIKNKLYADISYYFFELKNTIVSRRDSGGADYFVNAGKTRQQGLEASLNYTPVNNNDRVIRKLNTWINYTNIRARFLNYVQGTVKLDGNKLTGTSPNIIAAGIDIVSSTGIYTNLTYNYTGQVPVNDANSFYANAYNLFFTKLGYKFKMAKNISSDIFFAYNRSFNNPYSFGCRSECCR